MTPNMNILADVLCQTLCNAGYLDDAKEMICHMMDNASLEECIEHFVKIEHAVDTVNKFGTDCNVTNDFVSRTIDEAVSRGHSETTCLALVQQYRDLLTHSQ